jgi:ABC-2 type transport system ATP-binding protein
MTGTTGPTAAIGRTDGLAIALRGLRKSYGSHVALAGLDLAVPSGVVYGFLGPNGAGKTTTMRLLTGLIHPDAGSIELLGRPFERGDRRRLFDVGALIETPSFYPYLSGRENLRALAAAGAPTPTSRIGELLELVGLADRAGDAVSTYSLGMKQRLGIASALLSDPTLLLLDEPANGLDPAGIVALRDTLKQLAASGKTIFVSSHILGEVRELAEVVGIIANGLMVREGPMETLLQEGGAVRVRVTAADAARARTVLTDLAGPTGVSEPRAAASDQTDGSIWLSLQLPHERAAEVNRALAEVGIYASGLENESTLEALFLELTGGQATSGREGTFQGVSAAKTGSTGGGESGGEGEAVI